MATPRFVGRRQRHAGSQVSSTPLAPPAPSTMAAADAADSLDARVFVDPSCARFHVDLSPLFDDSDDVPTDDEDSNDDDSEVEEDGLAGGAAFSSTDLGGDPEHAPTSYTSTPRKDSPARQRRMNEVDWATERAVHSDLFEEAQSIKATTTDVERDAAAGIASLALGLPSPETLGPGFLEPDVLKALADKVFLPPTTTGPPPPHAPPACGECASQHLDESAVTVDDLLQLLSRSTARTSHRHLPVLPADMADLGPTYWQAYESMEEFRVAAGSLAARTQLGIENFNNTSWSGIVVAARAPNVGPQTFRG